MTTPEPPDPSNSPPEAWMGPTTDDSAQLNKLVTSTVDELLLGADLDRAEGIS